MKLDMILKKSKIFKQLQPQSPMRAWRRLLNLRGASLVLFSMAFLSGLGLLLLASATVVDYGPVFGFESGELSIEWQNNSADDELAADLDIDDQAVANDDDDDDDDLAADIPDYLRSESADQSRAVSMYSLLGLMDTILPTYGLEKSLGLGKESILDDSENRISEDFKIDDQLRSRVGFWFDVYSKFDSNHRIVHHSLYPWIVFKVVDVSMIINSDTPRHLWMRRQRADRVVTEETLRIRAVLKRLASRKNLDAFGKMTDAEKEIAETLKPLGGDLRKQALRALRSVRVQTGQKDFFMEGLRVSSRYLGTMEKIFAAHGLPMELTRIPLVESSFNKAATSKVGALGIWQFMNGTGSKYMLVSDSIDERRSPFKATDAAARLLKENHLILHHSWPLAVTAWNHGPTGMRKAMNRAGSRDLAKIIASYRSRSFDFASSNFYSEFLGALYAERYSDELFGELEKNPTEDLQAVKLSRSVRFNDLLRVSGMKLDEFLSINPDLVTAARRNLQLPRGFRLSVPTWALENLDRMFAIYSYRPEKGDRPKGSS